MNSYTFLMPDGQTITVPAQCDADAMSRMLDQLGVRLVSAKFSPHQGVVIPFPTTRMKRQ